MCDLADKRFSCLCREVNLLKEERVQQSELIATYRNQLKNRDVEIERLTRMLEGGRPVKVVNSDCCCADLERRLAAMTADFQKLDKKNRHLEHQAREAVLKQHEAMNRAVKLSDQNAALEKELHDLNFFAHAVKSDCNSNVKETSKRASQIQLTLQGSLSQMEDLEREVLELKRNKQETEAELEKMRNEKQSLSKILESTLDDKKAMTDRINQFTVIENDLNIEIDRLKEAVNTQKLRIAELESRILSLESQTTVVQSEPSKSPPVGQKKKIIKKPEKSTKAAAGFLTRGPSDKEKGKHKMRVKQLQQSSQQVSPSNSELESESGKGGMRKMRDLEDLTNRLQIERDFFFNEYHNLKDKVGNVPPKDDGKNAEQRRRLQQLEQDLAEARQMLQQVSSEKSSLQVRLDACHDRESGHDRSSPTQAMASLKTSLKRMERERDEAKGDLQRLQEERDALRERLKISTETQMSEHARFEQALLDSEDRARKTEAERRELLAFQGTVRGTINSLEEQLQQCREKAATTEHELSQQRMMYTQIKSLHEQTDRALADTQGHLTRDESELTLTRERVRELERSRAAFEREVAQLKNERTGLKASLLQVDQEKDALLIELDEKTERASQLNQELNAKESKLNGLQEKVNELQRKQNVILDENAGKEKLLRNSEQEVQSMRQELCVLQRAQEGAARETRRLTDDLAAATQDVRHARCELEQSRQEAEDLKRQLQDYVAEVQRVEELLAQKEGERGSLLDHFRSLSAEARSLESNNQSLNHVAEDTRTRLDSAQHRIMDLEMLVEARDSLVCGYETQISDLTSHVACLESRLHAETDQKARLESDLAAVRDLCVKLDSQKDSLVEATAQSGALKAELEAELARLQDELDMTQEALAKEQATIKSLKECVCSSREENSEGRVANHELQAEISTLHRRIDELQQRLDMETSEVRRYQQQAVEYSQQISELRRELTNEKFEKARLSETSRRSCQPGCSCLRTGVNRYAGVKAPDSGPHSYPHHPGSQSPVKYQYPVRNPGRVSPMPSSWKPGDYQTNRSSFVSSDRNQPNSPQTGFCQKDCKGIYNSSNARGSFVSSPTRSGLTYTHDYAPAPSGNSDFASARTFPPMSSSRKSDMPELEDGKQQNKFDYAEHQSGAVSVESDVPSIQLQSEIIQEHDSAYEQYSSVSVEEVSSVGNSIVSKDGGESRLPHKRLPPDTPSTPTSEGSLLHLNCYEDVTPSGSNETPGKRDAQVLYSSKTKRKSRCRGPCNKRWAPSDASSDVMSVQNQSGLGDKDLKHGRRACSCKGAGRKRKEALPDKDHNTTITGLDRMYNGISEINKSRETYQENNEEKNKRTNEANQGNSEARSGQELTNNPSIYEHKSRNTERDRASRGHKSKGSKHKKSWKSCTSKQKGNEESEESVYGVRRVGPSLEDHYPQKFSKENRSGLTKLARSSSRKAAADTPSSGSFLSASSAKKDNSKDSQQKHKKR